MGLTNSFDMGLLHHINAGRDLRRYSREPITVNFKQRVLAYVDSVTAAFMPVAPVVA